VPKSVSRYTSYSVLPSEFGFEDITGRREEALQKAINAHSGNLVHQSGQIIGLPGDITSKESLTDLVRAIGQNESHIDVLINNAGINKGRSDAAKGEHSANELAKELWQESFEDWTDVYRTNVIGHFFTAIAFLPLLAASTTRNPGRSASVINISSISGITNITQNQFKYNVSKAASVQLNQMLAQEFSRPGVKVRVNSIAPGIFPSEMTTGGSDSAGKSEKDAEGFREKKGIPAGRPGRDEDMAQAVIGLAVNQYVNGQTFVVDGGFLLTHP
jgi:NAD(P)-dependent dehydrogenase (short-subunit alcohol dehydrogenase family)